MTTPSTTCVKCRGPMELGLLVDSVGQAPSSIGFATPERVLEWVRGTPGRRWFSLTFKTEPEDRLQVATLRCMACGFVELYAPDPD